MKTKIRKYILGALLLCALPSFTGCSYLDVVPDERTQDEDTYKDVEAARRFLYSCYSFMPNPRSGDSSLDFFTGDEVITSFEHETFAKFPQGNFTADNPVISYWNTLYGGIRQSYKLMNILKADKVPGMPENTKKEMIAELNFLIGYYHMLLFRCYGPIIIVDDEIDVTIAPESYSGRSTLETTVKFICDRFDDAINSPELPAKRNGQETGRATTVAAYALKAYTLMYYASPLLNGGKTDYTDKIVDIEGNKLIPSEEDRQRWVDAREAYKVAIAKAHEAGFALFDGIDMVDIENNYPQNDRLRILRANLCTKVKDNPEEIWTFAKEENDYGLQKKSMPFVKTVCYNGIAPTMNMLRRFYTKNGLPYDKDPEVKRYGEFKLITLNEDNANVTFSDGNTALIAKPGLKTPYMNLNREPRYYAWISFQNGFYEVTNASYNGGYTGNKGNNWTGDLADMQDKVVLTDFTYSGNCGRSNNDRNYSPSGFLNKKGVHPDNQVEKGKATLMKYPWPLVRLGELYLGYAECCAESGERDEAIKYLNFIRERAGIPDVETSWNLIGGIGDDKNLVEIIRQERMIELYLENQNFWDMRRWLKADTYFHEQTGMDILESDIASFSKEKEINFVRDFRDSDWLLPIPAKDFNSNHNLTQNPGF